MVTLAFNELRHYSSKNMGPYSSGDKSIKVCYFQEKDKELDSRELPLSPLQDLFGPSCFHKLTCTFFHLLNVYDTCQNKKKNSQKLY